MVYCCFSNDTAFVTGARNGSVSLWRNKAIQKTVKLFDKWTLVLFKGDCIFAASENKDLLELNTNLDIVKKFTGRNSQPYTIDVNENYLVVGYLYSGLVDVHSRNERDQNGKYKMITVSFVVKIQVYL